MLVESIAPMPVAAAMTWNTLAFAAEFGRVATTPVMMWARWFSGCRASRNDGSKSRFDAEATTLYSWYASERAVMPIATEMSNKPY